MMGKQLIALTDYYNCATELKLSEALKSDSKSPPGSSQIPMHLPQPPHKYYTLLQNRSDICLHHCFEIEPRFL
jgi:hypothetical protein